MKQCTKYNKRTVAVVASCSEESSCHMQRCDASFKNAVRLRCYDALQREGFARFRKEDVDWPLDNDFHYWLGLNTALMSGYVQINPFVGIHAVTIGKLIASVEKGDRRSKYHRDHATYAVHIGEIAPHARVVRFTPEGDIDAETTRLARLCVAAGLPFAKSIGSYEKLLPLLQTRVRMLGGYPERVACCLYLMGQLAASHRFTINFLAKEPEYFTDFAKPFLEMLEKEPGAAGFGVPHPHGDSSELR
jgi:hypothetical protein